MTERNDRRREFAVSPPVWILGAVAAFFLLREARGILLPIAVALVLTFVLAPLVRRLRRRGIPEAVGAGLLVVALLAVLGVGISALSEPAGQWISQLPAAAERGLERVRVMRSTWPGFLAPAPRPANTSKRAARDPAPATDPLEDRLASEGVALTRAVVVHLGGSMVSFASTVVLLYFLLASEHWLLTRSVEAVPGRRARARLIGSVRAAQRDISHFLATATAINIGVGIVVSAVLMPLGLPSPVLWGVVAAVFNFIPYIGPITVGLLLLLAGVQTFGTLGEIVAPAVAFGIVHLIEASLVTPWLIGRRLALSSLSVVLSVMFWGWLWGVGGALIAVPLLIGLRSVCKRYRRFRFWCAYLDSTREAPSLRALLRIRRRAEARAVSAAQR